MKQFENFFKNRKEVEAFFDNEVFKFTFMGENMMTFDSLNPKFVDEELFSFSLSFYYEEGNNFFAYSSFKDWLCEFQLSNVTCESSESHERSSMFFRTYKES